ncbi:serine/threonine-protein kinase [Streptomyces sp. CB01881]|uniref:serine/threonine-protein kinase n=1 Tax=Streptomyces sp. CB01881 TaxID=2078691 RepID=UPI000CDBABAC|nr:serine/threonine-protein kinase [Streptomyces sp. CB01881]AUY50074.1 serine/threonine protein kinase [Streptomyces sp. CB01881]TYC73471.1 serine/threonine protein kinase [Streptomyces sp. CB01881]
MTADRVIGGRYRLAEKIGHGGMGQVWGGYDERLDRPVAVKLLRTDHLLGVGPSSSGGGRAAGGGASGDAGGATDRLRHGDELHRRFLRECRITAALDHPGLVTVFDAGEDDGELYLVMQRVPGVSLADLIAEDSPFPVERAVAVAAQLCAALAAVHAVPVVHRDLKPSNVMVRDDGRTVLLDLGIATALDTEATRLTLTGVPIGSPSYMAPEQALAAVIDPRSDLYALGCLLHAMLTGEEPFRAPTALGVLRRHVDEPPVPLREIRPDVPEPLERLVLDLLAKQPADRPAHAQQVYARLLPLLPAAVPAPQPRYGPLPDPTRPYRHPHQPQPRPGESAAAPAAVPTVAVPSTVAPHPAVPPPAVPPTAVPPAPRGEPHPFLMSAVPARESDLAAACARLSDLVDAGRRAEVLDLAATLLPRAQAELGDGAPLVRTVRTIYARTLHQERRYQHALPEYRSLAATADGGPHGPQGLEHRYRAAECLERLGRGAEALTEYRALLAADPGPEPDRAFDIRERIGTLLTAGGDAEAAWQWLLQLLFDRERRDGPHHPAVRRLRQNLDTLQAHRSTNNPDPRTTPWR